MKEESISVKMLEDLINEVEQLIENNEKLVGEIKDKETMINILTSTLNARNAEDADVLHSKITELEDKIKHFKINAGKIYIENKDDELKFLSKMMGEEVTTYPEKDEIELNRETDRVTEYLYDGGYAPFSIKTPIFKFLVKSKGFRTKDQIIIKPLLIPINSSKE